jgi:DNA-binding NtrC family response regulator
MTAAIAPTTFAPAPRPIESPGLLNLLIIDDDRAVREAAREATSILGYRASACDSAEQAARILESQNVDAVLLDLKLSGTTGLETLRQIKRIRPDIEVIVVTGHGTIASAVQAMKAGAYDYVTKPFSLEELKLLLERLAAHLRLKVENRMLREKLKSKQGFGSIMTHYHQPTINSFFNTVRCFLGIKPSNLSIDLKEPVLATTCEGVGRYLCNSCPQGNATPYSCVLFGG